MTAVEVYGRVLEFVRRPLYSEAHPGEGPCDGTTCDHCAVARRPDTGEHVLLWQCEGKNYDVSRNDPHHERHRAELAAA